MPTRQQVCRPAERATHDQTMTAIVDEHRGYTLSCPPGICSAPAVRRQNTASWRPPAAATHSGVIWRIQYRTVRGGRGAAGPSPRWRSQTLLQRAGRCNHARLSTLGRYVRISTSFFFTLHYYSRALLVWYNCILGSLWQGCLCCLV